VSTTVESTTTAPSTTASTAPQFIIPDDTIPPREELESSSDSGLSTNVELGLVVGGLMAVGALIGLLTVLYARHTRPEPYLAALDALSEVGTASGDVPTGRQVAIGPLPITGVAAAESTATGTPAATATTASIFPDDPAAGDTQSVRIVEPLALFGDASGDASRPDNGSGDADTDADTDADADGDASTPADASVDADAEASTPANGSGDEPSDASASGDGDDGPAHHPPLVTIEDLFGPSPEETSSPGS
jgi:hypothetical protein